MLQFTFSAPVANKAQVEEAVLDLLGWTEGYFRFEEGLPAFLSGKVAMIVNNRWISASGRATCMKLLQPVRPKVRLTSSTQTD